MVAAASAVLVDLSGYTVLPGLIEMNLTLIYVASLIATFVAWYLCNLIPARIPRGIIRATIISFLCSPGILIGNGLGVAPTLFALYVQPSIFTLGSMLVIWIIALGAIFGVPALRTAQNEWPPSAADIFLRAYIFKFAFFGVVAATMMQAFILADQRRELWLVALMWYGGGAVGGLVGDRRHCRASPCHDWRWCGR
jgi:hypothetical protein